MRPRFDYLADESVRSAELEQYWRWWRSLDKRWIAHPGPAVPLDPDLLPLPAEVAALRARQDQSAIAIGE